MRTQRLTEEAEAEAPAAKGPHHFLEHQRHVSQDERDARRPARHRATDEKYEQRDEGREAGRQGDPTAHLPTKARAHGDSGHLGTLARYSAVRPRPRLRLACNG